MSPKNFFDLILCTKNYLFYLAKYKEVVKERTLFHHLLSVEVRCIQQTLQH